MEQHSRRRTLAAVATGLMLASLPPVALRAHDPTPQIARGLVPPSGFTVAAWSGIPFPTSLAWGPDTRGGEGATLYVTSLDGRVYAVDDLGGAGGTPRVFASGLRQPLGLVFGDDGATLFVSDSEVDDDGMVWGLVRAFGDTDQDGAADTDAVVVRGLPNGRHNTNGLAFGPGGFLFVANGNRTDDGVECGPDPVAPTDCPAPELLPWSGSILRVDPTRRDQGLTDVTVVARGLRNVYDVAFHPGDARLAYVPMNGPDDPAADDVLYRTDVTDDVTDDMGFPACLYNPHPNAFVGVPDVGGHDDHGSSLEPQDNPNLDVVAAFGHCPTTTVTRPLASFGGHVSANGLAFAAGSSFPQSYQDDLFVAEWGNIWGLEDGHVSGHKIARVALDAAGLPVLDHDGAPTVVEFATGGLPLDLAFGPDGAMYVADMAGAVHRIAWSPLPGQ